MKEITDLLQLDSLTAGEKISFCVFQPESAEGEKINHYFCWSDRFKGRNIEVFARANSTQIFPIITEREWFRIVSGLGLVMCPPVFSDGRSWGYSYDEGDSEYKLLFKIIADKTPLTDQEIELFRRGDFYRQFFKEETVKQII